MPADPDHHSERFWNSFSARLGNTTNIAGSPALREMGEHGTSYLQSTDTLLDVGCGKGDITLEMAQYAKQVHGLDTSAGMIGLARRKGEGYQLDNVSFIHGNLFDDQFRAASYDVVTAFNVMPYVNEENDFLERIQRLLKPKGLFISSTACLGDRVTGTRIIMWILMSLRVVPRMTFYQKVGLEAGIEDAGFSIENAKNIAKLPERFIVARKK